MSTSDMPSKLSAVSMVEWLFEAAEELTGAHAVLDSFGVPRFNPVEDPAEFSLAARIHFALTDSEDRA